MHIPFLSPVPATHSQGVLGPITAAVGRRRSGLSRGERALAETAVARRLGDMAGALRRGADAARWLRDPRAVALLIEEGFPSPLTGRIGAIAATAGALAGAPGRVGAAEAERLETAGFLAEEIADLVMVCAAAALVHRAAARGI